LANQRNSSPSGSLSVTPATEDFTDGPVVVETVEIQRLKTELQEARNNLARVNQELHATHQIKSTFDHAVGLSSDTDYYYKGDITEQTISQLQDKFNASTRPPFGRHEGWPLQEDDGCEKSDAKAFGQAVWNNGARPGQYQNGWGMNMNTQNFGPIQVCKP
jgi:hypothetical protein